MLATSMHKYSRWSWGSIVRGEKFNTLKMDNKLPNDNFSIDNKPPWIQKCAARHRISTGTSAPSRFYFSLMVKF